MGRILDAIKTLTEENAAIRNAIARPPETFAVTNTSQIALPVPVDYRRIALAIGNTGNQTISTAWDNDAVEGAGFVIEPGETRIMLLVTQGNLHAVSTVAGSQLAWQEFTRPPIEE